MRPGNKDLRALAALVLGLLLISAGVTRAEGVESFVVGGVGFRVPAGFVVAQTGTSRSVMLRFHLPDFGVVDDRAFAGVYPEDDRPVLTVEISDDVSVPAGQVWLDQEIAYWNAVKASCWNLCENNFSSLGGRQYETFEDFLGPPPKKLPIGGWFQLFQYPDSKGAFTVCHFALDQAPTDCEMRERLSNALTIFVRFPIEYLSQGLELLDGVNLRLKKYESPGATVGFPAPETGPVQPPCWKPPGVFDPTKNIPLKIGPEIWHIPPAYVATFGENQTQDLAYDSFSIWLKLPDLEPLDTGDPNPFVIAGPGKYINLMFEFDRRLRPHKPERLSSNPEYLALSDRVGKNAFFDYDEYAQYQQRNSVNGFRYLYGPSSDIILVSKNLNSNETTFPPDLFYCSDYSTGGLCTFSLNEWLKSSSPNGIYQGHYFIEYYFSRAYFSQLLRVNACVQKLYEEFRYDIAP